MRREKERLSFKIVKGLIRLFYPRIEAVGTENLPEEPCIIVGNHCQLHGPLICELFFPISRRTWCAGQMMHWKEVPAYAYEDFWSNKPKRSRWYYKLMSYVVTPVSVFLFNNAKTIAVYHDTRLLSTFKETVHALQQGESIVIFPEHNVPHDHIIFDFQDRFIDIAKLYCKKSGREISFVPMYIAPRLKKLYLGKPVRFCSDAPMEEERKRICDYLMAEITKIASSLPQHTVVPYRNIPKKYYPINLPKEATSHEETGG